jgi:hypothetical protein
MAAVLASHEIEQRCSSASTTSTRWPPSREPGGPSPRPEGHLHHLTRRHAGLVSRFRWPRAVIDSRSSAQAGPHAQEARRPHLGTISEACDLHPAEAGIGCGRRGPARGPSGACRRHRAHARFAAGHALAPRVPLADR